MKTISQILILLLAATIGYSQTTYVPDDNFEQVLINKGYDTGALDNYVPTVNINTVTSLNVSSKSIADLTGIEDFVALEELRCNSNQLTSLDLSINIALTRLWCYNNQLTSLDFTSNTTLEWLDCEGNQLTSLDVTANNALTYLVCFDNQLTSLDFTTNTALTRLWCNDNQLTNLNLANGNNINFISFDATNNSSLTCIEVDDVAWSTTNWTNIDAAIASFSTNCATASTDQFELSSNFSVYPNPVKNSLTIDSLVASNYQIIDFLGKVIKKGEVSIGENLIHTQTLSKGIYFIKINTENKSFTKKIIVLQ